MTGTLYRVLLLTGQEIGPVDLNTLAYMAQGGQIGPFSPITDLDTRRQFTAADHPFLVSRLPKAPPSVAPRAQPRFQPAPPPPLPAAPNTKPHVFEEYARQWVTLQWWFWGGVLGIWAGPVGLALLIYAIIQKAALRRNVAESGADPEAFARAANARFWQSAKPLVIGVAAIVGAFFVLGIGAWVVGSVQEAARARQAPPPRPPSFGGFGGGGQSGGIEGGFGSGQKGGFGGGGFSR